jgi:hypothetical protein
MNTRTSTLFFLLFASAASWSQQPKPAPLTTFDDPADGITFKYPSSWKRVQEKGGYCPSMAIGSDMYGRHVPVTVAVQFTGKGNVYEHTSLQSLTFQFGTLKGLTDDQCDAIAKQFPQSGTKSEDMILRWTQGRGGECGLNNNIDARVFTNTIADRCYVIEADFDYLGGAPAGSRDLTPAEHKALQRHLDDIVKSVTIRSVTLPKSWATTTFADGETGVSFAYPAEMKRAKVKDVTGDAAQAMTRMHGLTWRAVLDYSPKLPPTIEEASTDLGDLTFFFATKPTSSSDECRRLIRGYGDDDKSATRTLSVHGVAFDTAAVSEAGTSHFTRGTLYSTYRNGLCYLFEQDVVGLDGYAGDITDAQWKEIDRHMDAIATTIQFAPAKL